MATVSARSAEEELLTDFIHVVIDKITLVLCYIHNPITETPIDKQRFPSCDGVGSDNGVFRNQFRTLVEWVTALNVISDGDAEFLSFGVEELGVVTTFKSLKVGEK
jgi:hypothetical protein